MTIDDLNEKYAIVSVGNKMCVMEFGPDGTIMELWDYDNFKRRFIKESTRVRTANGQEKIQPLADVWLRHRRGRQYNRLVYSMPGSPHIAAPDDYNGWQGFSVEPAPGDWSLNRDHIRLIICKGHDLYFRWVLNWMAALFQRPGQHAMTAIVLRGGQGIGKGHFFDKMIGKTFGPQQYIHVLGAGQLTAEFNEHISGKVFIFADESTWGGDPKAASKLKGMVTEDTIPIHRKFLKMIDEPSMLHIGIASNNDWPIPIDIGDRRFTVFDVDESRKQDQAYFGRLLAELKNGGHAAMLYELLHLDINEKWIREPLMTEAKAQIVVQSLKHIEHWWFEILQSGSFNDGPFPDHIVKREGHVNYTGFLDTHHRASRDRRATQTEMGMFFARLNTTEQQLMINGRRERVIYLPSLAECRTAWLELMKWPSDYKWDTVDDTETPDGVGDAWEPPTMKKAEF